MGVIFAIGQNNSRQLLATRNLVGRSRSADLHLQDPNVSGEHAVLWWDGSDWRLRDLASRNGTHVDGEPVPPGDGVVLAEGATITFGAEPNRWRLVDARPPQPFAKDIDSGAMIESTSKILVLPSEDAPTVTIYQDVTGTWMMEDADRNAKIHDLGTVAAGGSMWRVYLPEPQALTHRVTIRPPLETLVLEFEVSRDLEHVQLTAVLGNHRVDLKSRAHNYPLYVLAAERLRDQQEHPELPPETHGWIYQDDFRRLCGGMDDARINLAVFRARKHLASAGIDGAASVVERRATTRQIRIGVGRLVIKGV